MSHLEIYRSKRCDPETAVALVRDGDAIVVPTGAGEPPALLTALSDRRKSLHGVSIHQILAVKKFGYFDPETVDHIRHSAFFLGGASRTGAQQGWCDVIPSHFSEIPSLIRRREVKADVVFALASPMDENGYFALGLGADYTMAAVEMARTIILEVNPNVPYTFGKCHVHVSQVSAIVESEAPVLEVGMPVIGPVQEAIGSYVADLIEDGSTLQIGYGGIPDAVVMQLRGKRNLGIHSEMIGDGILSLVEAGAVDGSRKQFDVGRIIGTFALGSARLYQFMNRNPNLEMHPSDYTNDPYLAGRQPKLVAINASLQIDLIGQCGSESLAHAPYSGTGGQSDFVRAANRSEGGKAFIVLPSTAKNDTLSRIVPVLSPGTHVSTSKNDVNYVVTEFGVAQLRGKTLRQRAAELISIAHPDFRAELRAQAKSLGLM
ncbi:acetyl-CoA hydrolase/transferase family protein [Massilia sp. TS11]|uniref:acetyl-CoA hydrolase/transferase family protein n=1 Tax=Massilia sp. TS11 TaxID=2908003 RepID=UPI001ED9E7AD|nr:acetyl-CoA hydrolase/transferase C-terminal domain-containing protein [Massilia sp. TS11]MCG2586842.1 4-hydroxybutyrate CoA-transferase [Massilia sp. TS11]